MDDTVDSAREVAARVASRTTPGDWLPAETALALLIMQYVHPSKLGGTKRRRDGTQVQHPSVVAAARALGRTPDAVVFKVMNLRSVLTSGDRGLRRIARLDRATVERYAGRLDDLFAAALTIEAVLPAAAAMRESLASPSARLETCDGANLQDLGDVTTERIAERVERVGQGPFRTSVLANYRHECAFCGLRSKLPDENAYLLLASHIRPWSKSTGHERLDPGNGLALCAIHDRAFDWGFLSVDDSLKIMATPAAAEHYEPEPRVQSEILALHGRPILRPPRHFQPPRSEHLAFHRERIFDRKFRRVS